MAVHTGRNKEIHTFCPVVLRTPKGKLEGLMNSAGPDGGEFLFLSEEIKKMVQPGQTAKLQLSCSGTHNWFPCKIRNLVDWHDGLYLQAEIDFKTKDEHLKNKRIQNLLNALW